MITTSNPYEYIIFKENLTNGTTRMLTGIRYDHQDSTTGDVKEITFGESIRIPNYNPDLKYTTTKIIDGRSYKI